MSGYFISLARASRARRGTLSKPADLGKARNSGEVDYEARDRRGPPARVAVYQYGGPGDGGAALQAPVGPGTNRGKPIFIPRLITGVVTYRHYR